MKDSTKYLIIGLLLGLALMFLIGGSGGTSGRYEFHTVRNYDIYSIGKPRSIVSEVFYILDNQTGIAKQYSTGHVKVDFNKTK